jgi:hypothetical protein
LITLIIKNDFTDFMLIDLMPANYKLKTANSLH